MTCQADKHGVEAGATRIPTYFVNEPGGTLFVLVVVSLEVHSTAVCGLTLYYRYVLELRLLQRFTGPYVPLFCR